MSRTQDGVMAQGQKRTSLRQLREHLVCVLCGGYLIDATTIVECLHSFCKTCIVRYLDSSKFCPICDVQVHKTKPLVNIRMDHTLQDIVYKLVPGLFKDEMKRRREFYKENIDDNDNNGPWPEYYIDDDGEIQRERVIFSNDEEISLCLQLSTDGKPPKSPDKIDAKSSPETTDCRYLLCPAAVTVSHLKKFIRMKFNLCDRYQIDVYHTDEALRDHYTLMDIAYIYIWRRKGPLKLFYTVYSNPTRRLKRSASSTVTSDVSKEESSIVEMTCNSTSEQLDNNDKQSVASVDMSEPELVKTEGKPCENRQVTSVSNSANEMPKVSSSSREPSNVSSSSKELAIPVSKPDTVLGNGKPQPPVQESKSNSPDTKVKEVPKKKEAVSCTSINVPSPHRSFLLGSKLKDKTEKKNKDTQLVAKPRTQILSLPVKNQDAGQQSKSINTITAKTVTVPKVPTVSPPIQIASSSKTHHNVTNGAKVINNNSSKTGSPSVNSSSDKCNSKKQTLTTLSVPSDAKKPKLSTENIVKSPVYRNGLESMTKSNVHSYVGRQNGNHDSGLLSSADKTRKLLHIPERPIHPYVPMAHYQGLNGIFHYRPHIQDYGNDAPQDLSMKKKPVETKDKNGETTKTGTSDVTNNKQSKENEKEKNGEVDKYAFTDDDAVPVTSRKLQHVKSEPVTLS